MLNIVDCNDSNVHKTGKTDDDSSVLNAPLIIDRLP